MFNSLILHCPARGLTSVNCVKRPEGGGGYYNILNIPRLGSYFGVQNIEFPFFFFFFFFSGVGGGGVRKCIFLGVCGFCGYYWGSPQNWTIFRGQFYAF